MQWETRVSRRQHTRVKQLLIAIAIHVSGYFPRTRARVRLRMYVRRCELRHASRNSWRPTLRSCSRSRIVETGGPSHADQLWHGTLSWIRGPFPADRPILTRIPATRWLHQQYPAAASRSSLRGAFAPPASCVCFCPSFPFSCSSTVPTGTIVSGTDN